MGGKAVREVPRKESEERLRREKQEVSTAVTESCSGKPVFQRPVFMGEVAFDFGGIKNH
jgi:hypothetical protein